MSERRLQYMALDELQPAARNPKRHDAAGQAASVDRFGLIEWLVLDERTGRLVSGHGRLDTLTAARAAGQPPPDGVTDDWQVPVVRGWSSADDIEAEVAVVALNRHIETGGWDQARLFDLLGELTAGSTLTGVGFDQKDLDDLAKQLAAPPEPDLAYNPELGPGDGAHREKSIDEEAAGYRNSQIRSLVFDYPLADYTRVSELAAAARKERGVESNAELLIVLLRDFETAHPAGA